MANDDSQENDTKTGASVPKDSANVKKNYWYCSTGEGKDDRWEEFFEKGIMAIGYEKLGDLSTYHNQTEMKKKLRECYPDKKSASSLWSFCHMMKKGDIVFAKKGRFQVVGRGIIEGDYEFDESRPSYRNVRKVRWTHKGDWKLPKSEMGPWATVTKIKKGRIGKLEKMVGAETTAGGQQPPPPPDRDKWVDPFQAGDPNPFQGVFAKPYRAYTWKNFLGDVYLGKNLGEGIEKYGRLVRLLENRKNIILQGPPGVGKTYAAKRLAWSILNSDIDELKKNGGRDPRIQFVQFHQSYSYEDFVEGYKPNDGKEKKDGEFVLQPGVFRRFCEAIKEDNEKAAENGEEKKKFFFIIDEINRGNTSKIFGELLMLIENDHRGEETKLAYSRIDFSVPKNLYIIGMMNTADRNLAMIDYALRRRFAFVDVEPAFESDDENYGFKKYQKKLLERCNETEKTIFTNLIEEVRLLNDAIANDQSLRKGFRIGHSYFCGWENAEDITKKMQDVVECDIIPTLREYWFDAEEEVAGWESGFRSVLNGQEAKGKEELPKS